DPAFGQWVLGQRLVKNAGTLSAERTARLNAIGFAWQSDSHWRPSLDARWEEMFALLETFRKQYGHSQVPVNFPGTPSLGIWVSEQRAAHRRGELRPARRDRLEAAGFVWRLT